MKEDNLVTLLTFKEWLALFIFTILVIGYDAYKNGILGDKLRANFLNQSKEFNKESNEDYLNLINPATDSIPSDFYDKLDTEAVTVSPIVEQELILDYNKMPSYCRAESYTILKLPKGYKMQLPGGTIFGELFNTAEECQEYINEWANESKQRWIDSGGTDY
jgi:hypothetical protein